MTLYANDMERNSRTEIGWQLTAVASKWTPGLCGFLKYMQEPIIAIDIKQEAALYGQVKWVRKLFCVWQHYTTDICFNMSPLLLSLQTYTFTAAVCRGTV